MTRPFDFNEQIKNQTYFRQFNLCVKSGRSLIDILEHFYNIIPKQLGQPCEFADACIRNIDNCVMLSEVCPKQVHQDGRFRACAVAPPGYF